MSKKNIKWLFATNTNNLRMIIAQGLLSSPAGFSKYYQDILEKTEGWIPLFKDKIPKEILDIATCEASHLTPCIIELSMSNIEGGVKASKNNEIIDINLSEANNLASIDILFIAAPLPLSCLLKVSFENKAKLDEFKKDVVTRSNVTIDKLKLQSTLRDRKLFVFTDGKKTKQPNSSNSQIDVTNYDALFSKLPKLSPINYSRIYAYGGMLAQFFYFSKNGKKTNEQYESFNRGDLNVDKYTSSLIVECLATSKHEGTTNSAKQQMYEGIINIAIEKKSDFKNSILSFLEADDWKDEKAKERASILANMLKTFESVDTKKTVSDQFNQAKTPLGKLLLILFLREDSESLIDYLKGHHDLFTEDEMIDFALFFGIRDGFLKTPSFIREYKGLQAFISTKMAESAHQLVDSSIQFTGSKSPLTIWQLLNKKLDKNRVKILALESCVNTIMPKADFMHEKGKNIYLGYLEPKFEIVDEHYLKAISINVINNSMYNKLA